MLANAGHDKTTLLGRSGFLFFVFYPWPTVRIVLTVGNESINVHFEEEMAWKECLGGVPTVTSRAAAVQLKSRPDWKIPGRLLVAERCAPSKYISWAREWGARYNGILSANWFLSHCRRH